MLSIVMLPPVGCMTMNSGRAVGGAGSIPSIAEGREGSHCNVDIDDETVTVSIVIDLVEEPKVKHAEATASLRTRRCLKKHFPLLPLKWSLDVRVVENQKDFVNKYYRYTSVFNLRDIQALVASGKNDE